MNRLAALALVACNPLAHEVSGLDERPANRNCMAPARPALPVGLVPAFPALSFDQPIQLAQSLDGRFWYLIERAGRVWRFAADPAATTRELVLDISDHVTTRNDDGLVGLALHPRFATTGDLVLSYTAPRGGGLESRISRFHSSDGGATFAAASEQIILRLDQAQDYHVNSDLQFGPDGMLYAGFGDGAPVGTLDSPARDPNSLAGKILRIDIDGGTPYAIPADNPFATGGGAPEVYAYGLRNPWRFTFDRATGDLWAGDVGWSTWEEIDRITPGGYYGWSSFEANSCVNPLHCSEPSIAPVIEMGHDQTRSITAGYVYRGSAIPSLVGRMVFGDFVTGYLWSFDPQMATPRPQVIASAGIEVTSFAEDRDGELYVVDFAGTIWRVVDGDGGAQELPPTLSATGCFTADGEPDPGLIPYGLNWPFYSDGATKRRWFALPDGAQIEVRDGDLYFPVGTMVFKEFSLAGTRVETRVLVHHDDDLWAGYTYVWTASGVDAELLRLDAGSAVRDWPGQSWYYPTRQECLACHNTVSGRTLGPTLLELNGDFTYPNGRTANQLTTFDHIGLFATPQPPARDLPALPVRDDATVALADRARAWLHANCSGCHQPGASAMDEIDLRFEATLAETGICDTVPRHGSLDIGDARIIAPGAPARSVLLARVRADGANKMPPRAGLSYDADGAALLEAWISSLTGCD